ncbi:MAG TPA: hypothetical protein VLI04_20295 [Nocardioidaceae bacterium]|nr:hypothetical protein [Nocardioidaceae bacterium]
MQRSASWLVSLGLVLSIAGTAPSAQSAAPTPVKHGYVVNSLNFPTNADDARALGRDLTGDGNPDNQLGMVLTALAGQGLDLTSNVAATLKSGGVVILHSLRTTSLANARGATLKVLRGKPKANPDLNGGGLFAVDTTKPSVKLKARIKNYKVKAGPGAIPFVLPALAPGQQPVTLTVKKGLVTATCRRAKCVDGRINGAITMAHINFRLIPAFARLFQSMVDDDCIDPPGTCDPNSGGQSVLNLFDDNNDGAITAPELRASQFIMGLFAPDLDLNKDGDEDAMSFGVGFTSASARIRGD